jgi:hypothetical protein
MELSFTYMDGKEDAIKSSELAFVTFTTEDFKQLNKTKNTTLLFNSWCKLDFKKSSCTRDFALKLCRNPRILGL